MTHNNALWDAVILDDVIMAQNLCDGVNKRLFNLYNERKNILHEALKKSTGIVELIASEYPELITEPNYLGSSPMDMSISPLIKNQEEKMKILIQNCKSQSIDLGLVRRAKFEQYIHFKEVIESIQIDKEIHFHFPGEYDQYPILGNILVDGG